MRRLLRNKAKALRLAIEQSKREVAGEAVGKTNAARLAKEQTRAVRRMANIISSDDDSEDSDGSKNDDSTPPATDACIEGYSSTGHGKGKGPVRNGDFLCPYWSLFIFSFFSMNVVMSCPV